MFPAEKFHQERQFPVPPDFPHPNIHPDSRNSSYGGGEARFFPNFPHDSTTACYCGCGAMMPEKKFDHQLKNPNLEFRYPEMSAISQPKFPPRMLPPLAENGQIIDRRLMIPIPPTFEVKRQILKETIIPTQTQIHYRTKPAPIGTRRNPFQNINSMSEYALVKKLNEGSYGVVYQAIHKNSGTIVALKQMKNGNGGTGLPQAAFTEIKLLFSLNHPSILKVMEVVRGADPGDVYLAMEFMEQDLNQFIKSKPQGLSIGEVKRLMLQLLEGVSFLHRNGILHRDLKTENLLLNREGKLKICDFGLACKERKDGKPLNSLVATLWYRAPELLLGTTHYASEIDMWSVGCIMGELLRNETLFRGRDEVDQIYAIVEVLGTPTAKDCLKCPMLSQLDFMLQTNNLWQVSPCLSDLGLDLLTKLLSYDPSNRITAEAARNHLWFREFPLPSA